MREDARDHERRAAHVDHTQKKEEDESRAMTIWNATRDEESLARRSESEEDLAQRTGKSLPSDVTQKQQSQHNSLHRDRSERKRDKRDRSRSRDKDRERKRDKERKERKPEFDIKIKEEPVDGELSKSFGLVLMQNISS